MLYSESWSLGYIVYLIQFAQHHPPQLMGGGEWKRTATVQLNLRIPGVWLPLLVLASGSWNNYVVYQHIFLLLTYRSAARLVDVQLKTVTRNLDKVFSRHITAESKCTPPTTHPPTHTPPGLWSYAPWCAITSGLRGSCKLEDKSTSGLDFRPTHFHGF